MSKSKIDDSSVASAGDTRSWFTLHAYTVKDKLTGEYSVPFWFNTPKEASRLEDIVKVHGDELFYVGSFSKESGQFVFPDEGSINLSEVKHGKS